MPKGIPKIKPEASVSIRQVTAFKVGDKTFPTLNRAVSEAKKLLNGKRVA